jgi:hypothetical protein
VELAASSVQPWLETVGILLTALFTLAAVVTALWLQWLREDLRRPRLTMIFDPDRDDPFSVTFAPGYEALWLRLRVVNEWPEPTGGRLRQYLTRQLQHGSALDTAEDVEVLLARVRRAPRSCQQGIVPSRPLKWADVQQGTVSLASGVSRYVDIARIGAKPQTKNGISLQALLRPQTKGGIRLRLLLWPPSMDDPEDDPLDDRHFLSPGRSMLELVLSARGVRATDYTVAVDFEGGSHRDPRLFSVRVDLQPGRLEEYDEKKAAFRGARWQH